MLDFLWKFSRSDITTLLLKTTSSVLLIYYIDTDVLLKNIPLVKFIKNTSVSLSMISLISSLSLKLYLNSLVYQRNIFGSSSKVFGNLRQSSEILGKCSGAFVLPSEQF